MAVRYLLSVKQIGEITKANPQTIWSNLPSNVPMFSVQRGKGKPTGYFAITVDKLRELSLKVRHPSGIFHEFHTKELKTTRNVVFRILEEFNGHIVDLDSKRIYKLNALGKKCLDANFNFEDWFSGKIQCVRMSDCTDEFLKPSSSASKKKLKVTEEKRDRAEYPLEDRLLEMIDQMRSVIMNTVNNVCSETTVTFKEFTCKGRKVQIAVSVR